MGRPSETSGGHDRNIGNGGDWGTLDPGYLAQFQTPIKVDSDDTMFGQSSGLVPSFGGGRPSSLNEEPTGTIAIEPVPQFTLRVGKGEPKPIVLPAKAQARPRRPAAEPIMKRSNDAEVSAGQSSGRDPEPTERIDTTGVNAGLEQDGEDESLANDIFGGNNGGEGGDDGGFGGGDGGSGDNGEPQGPRRRRSRRGPATVIVISALALTGALAANAAGLDPFASSAKAVHKTLPHAPKTSIKAKVKPTPSSTSTAKVAPPVSSTTQPTAPESTSDPSSTTKSSETSSPSSSSTATTSTNPVVPPAPKISADEQCVSTIPEKSKIHYTLWLGVNYGSNTQDFSLFDSPDSGPNGRTTDHITINQNSAQKVAALGIGGLVVMKPSVNNTERGALKYLGQGYLNSAKASETNPFFLPMEVGTDQEGGIVQRYKVPDSVIKGGNLPSAQEAAETLTPEEYQALVEKDLNYLHKNVGINTVYGPVVDVAAKGKTAFEGSSRIYSSDPATVIKYATAYAQGAKAAGVNPVVKHFPGIGSATGNPDNGSAEVPSFDQLRQTDWKAFSALSKVTDRVMITSVTVAGPDGWKTPADLNVHGPATAKQFGYNSVITDDIGPDSGAIKSMKLSVGETVLEALQAGDNQVMLASVDVQGASSTIQEIDKIVGQAISDGKLSEHTLDQAVLQNLKDQNLDACQVADAFKKSHFKTPYYGDLTGKSLTGIFPSDPASIDPGSIVKSKDLTNDHNRASNPPVNIGPKVTPK